MQIQNVGLPEPPHALVTADFLHRGLHAPPTRVRAEGLGLHKRQPRMRYELMCTWEPFAFGTLLSTRRDRRRGSARQLGAPLQIATAIHVRLDAILRFLFALFSRSFQHRILYGIWVNEHQQTSLVHFRVRIWEVRMGIQRARFLTTTLGFNCFRIGQFINNNSMELTWNTIQPSWE